jgi:hypothetical protein
MADEELLDTTDPTDDTAPKPGWVKTTLNLPQPELKALKELSAIRHSSASEIIRRALLLEKLLYDTTRNGGKVLLQYAGEPPKQLIIR